jgi:hypothetical protein
MAERRRQRRLSCQLNPFADRHSAQKLAQVYRWLVPEEKCHSADQQLLSSTTDEKNSRHLR